MATPAVDIRLLGDKLLAQKLRRLPDKIQLKLVRAELRKSAKREQNRAVQAVSGNPVGIESGALLTGFAGVRVMTRLNKRRKLLYAGVPFPTKEVLGIDPNDKWFYPSALEYGTVQREGGRGRVDELRYLRGTVDNSWAEEISSIKHGLGRGLKREWRKAGIR